MITDKLTAMHAADRACREAGLSSLEGSFDPATGSPIKDAVLGSAERLIRSVINDIFNEEGVDEGPTAAMHRIGIWLRDMSREIACVADHLDAEPAAPDFGDEEAVA